MIEEPPAMSELGKKKAVGIKFGGRKGQFNRHRVCPAVGAGNSSERAPFGHLSPENRFRHRPAYRDWQTTVAVAGQIDEASLNRRQSQRDTQSDFGGSAAGMADGV